MLEFEPQQAAGGIKNVTMNEPFFQGHFPGYPDHARGAGGGGDGAGRSADHAGRDSPTGTRSWRCLPGIEKAKFRRPVTPGDQMRFEVDVLSFRSRAGRIEGRASVDGKLACEATLTCAVVTREREERAHGDTPHAGGAGGGAAAATETA